MLQPADDKWRDAYGRYRNLERELNGDTGSQGHLVLLRNSALGLDSLERAYAEHGQTRLRSPSPATKAEFDKIAEIRSSYDLGQNDFVFDDVYHLAFDNLTTWPGYAFEYPPADMCQWFFRGQRVDTWDIGAKVYRELPAGPVEGNDEIRNRATLACQVAHAMLANSLLPDAGFSEAMAVAQHYSDDAVLNVSTWLADFSKSFWVALFFASYGGREPDKGIVWSIMNGEYGRRSAGLMNPLGSLQLIVPSNIRRIDNQKGVFINAAIPEMFAQYVPFGWHTRFHQRAGLVFEDEVLGITENTMYPKNDPLPSTLKELGKVVRSSSLEWIPKGWALPDVIYTDPYDAKTYELLMDCWLGEKRSVGPEPSGIRVLLPDLARYHALLNSPSYRDRLPRVSSRSINCLFRAFEALYNQANSKGQLSVRECIQNAYTENMINDPSDANVLREALGTMNSKN